MKMFIESTGGLISTLGGIYLMYLYLTSLDTKPNILLMIFSLILMCAGIALLIIAGRSDTLILNKVSKPEIEENPIVPVTQEAGLEDKIEKNNAMLEDWKKTNETKQRLKLLEMEGAANGE